jgi:hypothetical protein
MSLIAEPLDENDLERRLQRQKALVARLVSEGKSTIEANAELYELSNALCSMRERRRQSASSNSARRIREEDCGPCSPPTTSP